MKIENAQHALNVLESARMRIEPQPPNSGNRGWQVGGAYWRLAAVLHWLDSQMDENEKEHAEFIRKVHGRLCFLRIEKDET